MNNTRNKSVICFYMAIAVLVIGLICSGIANYRTEQANDSLLEELNNTTEILTSTQAELVQTQNDLMTAHDKSIILQDELNKANEIIASREGEIYFIDCEVTEYEINMLAKTVWGEARGCNKLEQSAVVWCILNRVDDGQGSIAQVITAPDQFHGYSSSYPVTKEIKALCEDVVARWKLEKMLGGDFGRTLPSKYLFFSSDKTGIGNVFRTAWSGNYEVWDWDCWNPYS